MKNLAIITAAGLGSRMGSTCPKQYLELRGKPILSHTLEQFQKAALVDAIVLVTDRASIDLVKNDILKRFPCPKVFCVVTGGEKRQDSVAAGIRALPAGTEVVAVHDGVRPFVSANLIDESVRRAKETGACIVAIPVKDTIKRAGNHGEIAETLDRTHLWRAQTPQTFKFELLESAMSQALAEGFYGTDEAMLIERIGHRVELISGDERNIKITTPEDLIIAEAILQNGAI